MKQSVLDLWNFGDPSVGINGDSARVIFDDDFAYDADYKEQVRKAFLEVFENLTDQKSHAEWVKDDDPASRHQDSQL